MSDSTATGEADDLAARLVADDTFDAFVSDCTALVKARMHGQGMVMRGIFAGAQRIKPDIVERAVRELLPGFVDALAPCFRAYVSSDGTDLRAHLIAHDGQVADAALAVADRRAERIQSRPIHSAYQRIRVRARREVLAAVPELATLIARHAEPGATGYEPGIKTEG